MKYLLDANTYIQAKNLYYNMDFCPAYWDWLDLQCQNGLIASIDQVGRELRDGNDELASWTAQRAHHFLDNADQVTQSNFVLIAKKVMEGNFNPANRDLFLAKADPWLIAKAMTLGATVVSNESHVDELSRKVKVPNICQAFDVPCISTFKLLKLVQARFVLPEDQA